MYTRGTGMRIKRIGTDRNPVKPPNYGSGKYIDIHLHVYIYILWPTPFFLSWMIHATHMGCMRVYVCTRILIWYRSIAAA